jgi:nucleoside-diphosphate-sugar epimerase
MPLRSLKKADLPLIDNGMHPCNAVYVDDVVQAILRACLAEGVEGRRYLICNDEQVTWADFFGAYEAMLGFKCLVPVTYEEIVKQGRLMTRLKQIPTAIRETLAVLRDQPALARSVYQLPISQAFEALAPPLLNFARSIYFRSSSKVPGSDQEQVVALRKSLNRPMQQLSPEEVAVFSRDVRVDISRARSELGYVPEFPLERGMQITGDWAQYVGLCKTWA